MGGGLTEVLELTRSKREGADFLANEQASHAAEVQILAYPAVVLEYSHQFRLLKAREAGMFPGGCLRLLVLPKGYVLPEGHQRAGGAVASLAATLTLDRGFTVTVPGLRIC